MNIVGQSRVPLVGERADVIIEAVVIIIRCSCETAGDVLTFRVGELATCPKCHKRYGMQNFSCAVGRVMNPGEILPVSQGMQL